jgi:excisionase family DNA binding protein
MLRLYGAHLRVDGLPMPAGLAAIIAGFGDTEGHTATSVDVADDLVQGAAMGLVLFDFDEVAARLHVSVRSVERLVADGRLRVVQLSPRERRVRPADLEAFIDSLEAA